MKRIYLSILAASMLFAACKNAPEGDKATVSEEQEVSSAEGTAYTMKKDQSMITFYGATPTHGQTGAFPINEGTLYVNDGKITGGSVSVMLENMEVKSADLSDDKKEKLKGHLLGEDFFNSEVNPEVKFQVTKIESAENEGSGNSVVTGNLTMHGSTNSISFPAQVQVSDSLASVDSKFVINRKDWGMSYKNDKSLGDDWIYDEVQMTVSVQAKK